MSISESQKSPRSSGSAEWGMSVAPYRHVWWGRDSTRGNFGVSYIGKPDRLAHILLSFGTKAHTSDLGSVTREGEISDWHK